MNDECRISRILNVGNLSKVLRMRWNLPDGNDLDKDFKILDMEKVTRVQNAPVL